MLQRLLTLPPLTLEPQLCSLLGAQLPPRTLWAPNKESEGQWDWDMGD